MQRNWFPAVSTHRYCPTHGRQGLPELRELVRVTRLATDADHRPAALRGLFDDLRDGRPLLLSDEGLSWAPDDLDPRAYHDRVAGRLAEALPDAHVVVTLREQAAMLWSFYAEHVGIGLPLGLADYLDESTNGAQARAAIDRLRYDELVEAYQKAFGEERTTVLLFEQLRTDPESYLAAFAAVLGAPAPAQSDVGHRNRQLSRPLREVLRTTNRLAGGLSVYPVLRPKLRRFLQLRLDPRLHPDGGPTRSARDDDLLASLRPRFAASNQRLAELTGLDVSAHGYAC